MTGTPIFEHDTLVPNFSRECQRKNRLLAVSQIEVRCDEQFHAKEPCFEPGEEKKF